jgi:hypothetical protein
VPNFRNSKDRLTFPGSSFEEEYWLYLPFYMKRRQGEIGGTDERSHSWLLYINFLNNIYKLIFVLDFTHRLLRMFKKILKKSLRFEGWIFLAFG